MDNNYLFLAMQTGGQLSPEQLQRAQQMGQLPQMNMGAGLNDIQKKNMAEAQHYNMFRKGGVPKRYAEGGEQEEIDQQYMSPYTQYNQRVSDFLQNLRATSMNALQDEMVGVNDEYAEEADQIEMEQAQYGRQVSQSTVNPQGMAAVNAWTQAAQNTKDLTKPLAQTAGLMSGLKGYFGDKASYEANPYNAAWNPTRLTMTNVGTGEKTVTRAGRDGFFSQPAPTGTQAPANTNTEECTPGMNCFEYGGQYFQIGGSNWEQQLFQGTPMAPQQAQPQRGTGDMLRVQPQGSQYSAEAIANARAMGWGDDVAGYANSGWGVNPASLPKTTKKKSGTKTTPAATTTTTAPAATTDATKKAEEEKKKADEAKKAEEDKKAKEEGKTTTTEEKPKEEQKKTGEVDYLAMLADPTGQNAGGVYRTDKNGNPVPMAFYDPNMRLTGMDATYRNNAASWFRKNKKPGQMKSVSFDFASGTPYTVPGTQTPAANTTAPTVANNATTPQPGTTTTPASNQSAPAAQPVPNQTSRFFPQAPQPTTTYPGGPFPAGNVSDANFIDEQWKEAAANWRPGMQWNGPQNMLPSSIRQTPKVAPGSATQSMIAPSITPGMQNVFPYAPATGPVQPQVQPQAPAPLSGREQRQQIRQTGRENRRNSIEEANRRAAEEIQKAIQGYAYGGQYFQIGGEEEGIGVLANPVAPETNTNFFETGLLPKAEESNYMSPALPGETVIEQDKMFRATYDKNKKSNPFFAPAMLAGLNLVAGAAENMDAKKKEKEARGKFSYDQIYTANPETSGSRGDWTVNEGYKRPNDTVATQFTGAGRQMQWGGAYAEGDELYLDEDAIQAFLAAGGQLDYLD
jgi:hypothetical protein